MNKSELIQQVRENAELSSTTATKAVEAALEVFTEALNKGEAVNLIGFGSFVIAERAERQGRNPRTGESLTIPATKQVKFKAGKGLKDGIA